MKSFYSTSGYNTAKEKENDNDLWDTDHHENNNNENSDESNDKNTPIPFLRRMYISTLPWIQLYRPLGSLHSIPNNDGIGLDSSSIHVQDDHDDIYVILYRLRILATACTIVSAFFWGWAVINTSQMEKGQDLGLYTFMTTFLSSHWLLSRTLHGPVTGQYLATMPIRIVVTTSHVLVTCNYLLGLLYSLTVGSNVYYIFGIYCLIFTFLWGGCSAAGWWLLTQLHKIEIGDIKHGGKYHNNDDDPLDLGW